MDRQTILRLNAMKDAKVDITRPGDMIETPDGDPLGMSETEHLTTKLESLFPAVPESDLPAAGLTPGDVPNVRVIEGC
jgi:hypothetical protein